MKKLGLLLMGLLLGATLAHAQTLKVSGTVTGADDGMPLPGVSVVVKGTTTGTATDMDGKYTLNVPADAQALVFSYIGYATQEVSLAGRSNNVTIDVALESEAVDAGEVVITALGISREKKSLGYAVSEVKSEELTQGAANNLASALQGKTTGVQISTSSGMPGASSKMTIRGSRSFTGNNTPLYVVDGMPIASTADMGTGNSVTGSDYANRALDIDPNDIESINILKGQAASALYGMRASNGVVVITTKSGAKQAAGRPIVTLNSTVAFDVLSARPELQTRFAQGSGGKYNPTSSLSWGPRVEDLPNDPSYGGNTTNQYTNRDGMHQGMYYVQQREKAGLDPWVAPATYDNISDFFQTGLTNSNSVSVTQNLGAGHYAFSLGNTYAKGIVPSTGLTRYNAKLNAEAKLSKNFTTGFSGNYVQSFLSKQTGANNGISQMVFCAPTTYDLKGIPTHEKNNPYARLTFRGGSFDPPYWAVEHNSFTERSQRFYGNTFLKYTAKLAEGHTLNLKYQVGIDSYSTIYSDIWGYGHAGGSGSADEYTLTVNELNSLFTAAYQWNISDDLVFDALVGNEFVDGRTKFVEAYGANFAFPGWNNMRLANDYQADQSFNRNRTVGTFANLSIAFKNMLFLNATGRYDKVSTMPRDSRGFFYPSVSLGFIFTELEPLQNEILSFGKLRLSYAEVGQAGTYYAPYYTTPTYGSGFSSATPMQYPINDITAKTFYTVLYDPNLHPQNTKSYEAGLDLNFLNGMIDLSYTFSRQNVKDQIFAIPMAGSTGYGSKMANGGSIHTNAHEVTLNIKPIDNTNFKWDFGFNFSKIDNYVDELAEGVESIFLGGFVEPQVRAGIGDKFPVIYGYSYKRNDAGKIVVDADGLPIIGEEKVIGSVSPDFTLGFNNHFEIFKVNINATLEWSKGGQMYYGTLGMLDYYGVSQYSADLREKETFIVEDAVKEDGTPNDIQLGPGGNGVTAFDYLDRMSDISEAKIYDKSFIKLREVSLSYPVLQREKVKLDVNLFARNIILWSKIKGFDPEVSQGNTNMSGAFERFSLPNTTSYGIGLNFKF